MVAVMPTRNSTESAKTKRKTLSAFCAEVEACVIHPMAVPYLKATSRNSSAKKMSSVARRHEEDALEERALVLEVHEEVEDEARLEGRDGEEAQDGVALAEVAQAHEEPP